MTTDERAYPDQFIRTTRGALRMVVERIPMRLLPSFESFSTLADPSINSCNCFRMTTGYWQSSGESRH